MNCRTSFAAALVCLLAGPLATAGQDVPAILTLEDAIRIARQSGPEYRKAANDVDVASAAVRQNWAAFLPDLRTSMGFNGSSNTRVTGEDDFGRPVRLPDPVTFENSSASQGVNLSMTLFDGGRMFRNVSAARAGERAAEAAVSARIASLDAAVTREFYRALRTDMLIGVEQRNLDAARERLGRTEQSFRIAGVSQVDLLEARRSLILAEQSLAGAETEARKARLSLRLAIGLEGDVEFDLATDAPEVFDPATLSAAGLVARAQSSSPIVLQTEAAHTEARSRASAARAGRWPTLSGSFGYSRSISQRGYGAIAEINPLNHGFGFSLSASFPIFTRFQTSGQIAQADAAAEDAGEDLRRVRLEIERDVRSGIADLEQAFRQLRASEEIATLSAQQVDLAEAQFRAGSLGFLQFQQVIDANATAQRQVVEARFSFLTARVALEERLGDRIGT